MSRIKSSLLGLAILCFAINALGQNQITEPNECKTPSGGIVKGGSFIADTGLCLDYNIALGSTINPATPLTLTGGTFDAGSVRYLFNYKDSDGAPQFPANLIPQYTYTTPGTYWIMMTGKSGGKSYITCRSVEVILPEQPVIKTSSCDPKNVTIKILNDPINLKLGSVRIDWGDGTPPLFYPIDKNNIPAGGFDISYSYTNPPIKKPAIQGVYVRSNINLCFSSPVYFSIGNSNAPRITELEGLTGGSSDKITMSDGKDGTDYNIQIRPSGGNWTDSGKKVNRATANTTASETVTGLNGSNQYCFRLQSNDGCATASYSNEVCTIKPTSTLVSPKVVKIDWSVTDPKITRYLVSYKESPTGANPNTASPVTPTATTYTFDQLYCDKKYNFSVTGFIGTTPADRVVIKSPEILVDPSTIARLPPPATIGTVSLIGDQLTVNLFEPSGNTAPKYVFYRSEGNSTNFTKVAEITTNRYDDKNVEPDKQQYCYKIEYQDECGNSSELSPPFCSVFLTSAQANTLNWTPFGVLDGSGALQNPQPVEYYIELLDANGSVANTVDITPDLESNVKDRIDQVLNDPNAKGKVTFRILARQKATIDIATVPTPFFFSAYSNTYTFITPAQIYVPTAFSPNSDGQNDIFVAKGRFIVEFNLVIYDRWGNVIFESKDMETGWNGSESDGNTPAPPGNYGFRIYGLDPAGQKFDKKGSVTLIR